MKSSLKKLRGFALNKSDARAKRSPQPFTQIDELAQATQDMQDMRNCYDRLFSAAAVTTNTAYANASLTLLISEGESEKHLPQDLSRAGEILSYHLCLEGMKEIGVPFLKSFEFSESLRELGSCLLEKTALNDDEDSGRVLLMLGKAQYQIQKFIDSYRSHISKTITSPSDSLLNELLTVEEMKRHCDDKRIAYEHLLASQRERARSRNSRENISPEKLQAALEEYEDEVALFIFRLKSLKQGQSRSLLTQAVRHHAAQMKFFKKGFELLESVDPHVKVVTEKQQIDYQFSSLEEEDAEQYDDDSYDVNDDGELSSDSEQPLHATDTVITTRQSVEAYQVNNGSNVVSAPKDGSFSAPIMAYHDDKIDTTENLKDARPSTARKFNSYALPTPGDAKTTVSAGKGPGRQLNISGQSNPLFHSLPLAPKKEIGSYGTDQSSRATHLSKSHSVLKESNTNDVTARASVHLGEGVSLRTSDWRNFFDNEKVKRQAFSGPLTGKPWPTKPESSAGGSTTFLEHSMIVPGMFTRVPTSQQPYSSKLSPSSSPPLMSSTKISELHELPRPPGGLTKNDISSQGSLVAHSAPLVSRSQQRFFANKISVKAMPAPLPRPPGTMPRSFSIPSRGRQRVQLTDFLEPPPPPPLVDLKAVEVSSPPLTPITFPNRSMPAATETISRTTE